ncbi:MAG: MarR family transcriptional regulator [Alphaproteobacteria bacterium]|nr:MarR family transcriptional regulator [Alphaproteobacteria bacterium]MDE2013194.1 MarR family transcriptional regulator [Alphaproteobacteria bacterium]MDE2073156.1 MarR family transcriptional regulator [Alphaproteobacteria bacterium]MDE2351508.1 MarR family transcriptional regulator [Alphaproteobacteria bacterium]
MPDSSLAAKLTTSYMLKRAELAVRNCLEVALQQFDLTANQYLMLLRLRYDGPQSSAQFARAIGVRPQSVTDIIGPLENKGLIQRRESPENRRILLIALTPKGRQLVIRARNVTLQLDREMVAGLDAQEVSVLRKALEKIRAAAECHECHPAVRRQEAMELARARANRPWRGRTSRDE